MGTSLSAWGDIEVNRPQIPESEGRAFIFLDNQFYWANGTHPMIMHWLDQHGVDQEELTINGIAGYVWNMGGDAGVPDYQAEFGSDFHQMGNENAESECWQQLIQLFPEITRRGIQIDHDAIMPGAFGKTTALQGLPESAMGPHPEIQQTAQSYMDESGLLYNPPIDYRPIDPSFGKQIANQYEAMEHNPEDPRVVQSYEALKYEVLQQYHHAVDSGFKFEFYPDDHDPYPAGPKQALEDLHQNHHLYVYPTTSGYGMDTKPIDHPMLQDTGIRWNSKPVTYNDLFRAVHDFYGHAKEGVGFRAEGEDNAYRQHAAMFSEQARPAMTTETRGQNSWVNYGPYGEHNQTANQQNTVYADQKAGIMPDWTMQDSRLGKSAMAERTGDPIIDVALEQFMNEYVYTKEWPDSWGAWDEMGLPDGDVPLEHFKHPGVSDGMCAVMANELDDYLGRSLPNTYDVFTAEDAAPDVSAEGFGYHDRTEDPGHFEHHWVMVRTPDETVYGIDFTASQYGYKEFPMVQRLDGLGYSGPWTREWKDKTSESITLAPPRNDLTDLTIPTDWTKTKPEWEAIYWGPMFDWLIMEHPTLAEDAWKAHSTRGSWQTCWQFLAKIASEVPMPGANQQELMNAPEEKAFRTRWVGVVLQQNIQTYGGDWLEMSIEQTGDGSEHEAKESTTWTPQMPNRAIQESLYFHRCPMCGGYLTQRGDFYTCSACPFEWPPGGEKISEFRDEFQDQAGDECPYCGSHDTYAGPSYPPSLNCNNCGERFVPEDDHHELPELPEDNFTVPKFGVGDTVIDKAYGWAGIVRAINIKMMGQWWYSVEFPSIQGRQPIVMDARENDLKRPSSYDQPGQLTMKDLLDIPPEAENYYRNASICQNERVYRKSDTIDPTMTPENQITQTLVGDEAANAAYETLTQAGGVVYVVGGAVRDAVLGNRPKDIDLMVTGLTGDEVTAALSQIGRVDLTGKQFGVYRLRKGSGDVEIALPRTEESVGAGHRDFHVQADPNLPIEEDLRRRDFTVNAMAYNPTDRKITDPYGGTTHAMAKQLSLVNEDAFKDDPLRIARALTAQSRHGLEPDQQLKDSMTDHAPKLRHLPGERIQMEMDKLLSGKDPVAALKTAYETGVMDYLAPELISMQGFDQNNPHHELPVDEHTLQALRKMSTLSNDPDLRLAILFHDSGKPASYWRDEAQPEGGGGHFYKKKLEDGKTIGLDHQDAGADLVKQFMQRNRYPNDRQQRVQKLVQDHMWKYFDTEKGARKFLRESGDPKTAWDLLLIRQADASGKRGNVMNDYDTGAIQRAETLLRKVIEEDAATSVKDLAINGKDLIDAGMQPGREIGYVLNEMLERVIDNPELNTKDSLLGMLPYV